MRVECERCHALAAAELELVGDGVIVTCAACGGSFSAPVRTKPASAPASTPAASPAAEPGCVKCGAPMTADPACPRCGLARERATTWAAADQPPAADLAAAWTATVDAWDEPAAHDRVAGLALDHSALPWLARRYREVQRARPDDAVARARIERIGVMTMAALAATATVPPAPLSDRRAGAWVVVILVLLVVAGLLAAKASSQHQQPPRRSAIPADRIPGSHGAPPPIEPPAPGR